MSTQPELHTYPHQRPHEQSMSFDDWAEAIAVGLLLFTAFAVIATLFALLAIV